VSLTLSRWTRPLQACAKLKDGPAELKEFDVSQKMFEFLFEVDVSKKNFDWTSKFNFDGLTMAASHCGLPVGTVKLTPNYVCIAATNPPGTCRDVTHTFKGGMCDGTQMSSKICMPAGSTQTTVPVTGGFPDNSSCIDGMKGWCGSAAIDDKYKVKDGYCTNKQGILDLCPGILRYKKAAGEFGTPCSVDSDCTVAYKPVTRYCCSEWKRLWPYACTGIDSGKFDAAVSVCSSCV
jgi:hypothetical protein